MFNERGNSTLMAKLLCKLDIASQTMKHSHVKTI